MLVVDVETTSLDPRLGSIVSIGAVDFENPQNQFYIECRIWEGAQVHPKSLEINGMDEKSLVDTTKPTEKEAIETFFNWARKWRNQPIAGQNTDFDNSYLKQAAKRNDVDHVFGYRIIDLHSIAYAKLIDLEGKYLHFDLNNLSTENIYKFVGLPKEPEPHHALTGAKMEAEAFSRLFYGRWLLIEFAEFSVPEYLRTQP